VHTEGSYATQTCLQETLLNECNITILYSLQYLHCLISARISGGFQKKADNLYLLKKTAIVTI